MIPGRRPRRSLPGPPAAGPAPAASRLFRRRSPAPRRPPGRRRVAPTASCCLRGLGGLPLDGAPAAFDASAPPCPPQVPSGRWAAFDGPGPQALRRGVRCCSHRVWYARTPRGCRHRTRSAPVQPDPPRTVRHAHSGPTEVTVGARGRTAGTGLVEPGGRARRPRAATLPDEALVLTVDRRRRRRAGTPPAVEPLT
ncbi:hypothetical protein HBB16_08740 [Pseudonocardia sp. MCCB 268]|nr:hypothetical protein [Pseudonocardia cytotoxica]